MFAGLPESGLREGGAAPVYSVANVGLIWLPIPLKQSPESLRDFKPQAVVSAATTSGRGEKPHPTGIRGIRTPKMLVWSASCGGRRSASVAGQINHKSNFRLIGEVAAPYSEAADLDQASQFPDRSDHTLSADCVEPDTVVGHQNGLGKLSGAPGEDEVEGEARLAGARGAADQDRAAAHLHRGSMDARGLADGRLHGAGSLTTKRAPVTVGSPSSPTGPIRFSAQMRPLWASMICLEIDSPRPEFWPKP